MKITSQINNETEELISIKESDRDRIFLIEMQKYLLAAELTTVSHMRIIYVYKQFEVHLKKIISLSYSIEERKLFKWDTVKIFLKTKNIDITNLNKYHDINELRELNNSIKHSDELINSQTKNILEFKNRKNANSRVINEFYERIKNSPKDFITELAKEIDKDLYEFTDQRLTSMAEEINNRMDNETKNKFVENLKNN